MRTIRVVGLTGQTGAGKSSVCKIIQSQGIAVIDCDLISREVLVSEKKCLADLALEFSIVILNADGTLNRKRLGAMVFGDAKKLARLNTLIFPYIRAMVSQKIDELERTGAPLAFLDAPTLFESGADADCDRVVSVIAPENVRLNRIVVRDHLTDDEARQRIASQHPDAYYIERSRQVIRNEGSLQDLHLRTLELLETLRYDLPREENL